MAKEESVYQRYERLTKKYQDDPKRLRWIMDQISDSLDEKVGKTFFSTKDISERFDFTIYTLSQTLDIKEKRWIYLIKLDSELERIGKVYNEEVREKTILEFKDLFLKDKRYLPKEKKRRPLLRKSDFKFTNNGLTYYFLLTVKEDYQIYLPSERIIKNISNYLFKPILVEELKKLKLNIDDIKRLGAKLDFINDSEINKKDILSEIMKYRLKPMRFFPVIGIGTPYPFVKTKEIKEPEKIIGEDTKVSLNEYILRKIEEADFALKKTQPIKKPIVLFEET